MEIKTIPLPTKVHIVKAMIFLVVMYRCESWIIKQAECQRIDAFELWCLRRLSRVPWTARRSNQSIQRKSVLNIHWKDWYWSWNSNILATWFKEQTHWKRPWCWEKLKAGEGHYRGWDGWMASPTPQPRQHIKKQRHYFTKEGPSSQSYVFSNSHVWMWELDYKESWAPKNWCFWTVVLEKTLKSPLDCKEIKPVNPKEISPEYSLKGLVLKLKLQ